MVRRHVSTCLLAVFFLSCAAIAVAQDAEEAHAVSPATNDTPDGDNDEDGEEALQGGENDDDDDEGGGFGTTAQVLPPLPGEGGTSTVARRQMDLRASSSAPEALLWEPGVAIQQTSHAQASPYVRGLTGQRVLHLFDGVRLNHAIYRQGPNQYFFTVDERTLAAIEVRRGSASVASGAGAMGGVIAAEPRLAPLGAEGVEWRPRLYLRYGSADQEVGGRAELGVGLGPRTGILIGGGYRDLSALRSGGVVPHRTSGGDVGRGNVAPWVPRFEEEGESPTDLDAWRTQVGTGFREATFDARVDHRFADLRASVALYGYRQFDAPRTDQCPPPEAPLSECLVVDRQFRTLAYATLTGDAGPMRDLQLTVAYQRHDESRSRDRPRSNVALQWRDIVDSLQASFAATSAPRTLGRRARLRVRYGLDVASDGVSSSASQTFTDLPRTFELSRGQYLDGARYVSGAAHVSLEVRAFDWLRATSGARAFFVGAEAPGDEASGSAAVDQVFGSVVANAGIDAELKEGWHLSLNLDQGFRAPNLDDLTSRQQVGPGFQFENASLRPEQSLTTELGLRGVSKVVSIEAWAFLTTIEDAIQRVPREAGECPPQTPDCLASRDAFQLVNAGDSSLLVGGEGSLVLRMPASLTFRSTVSVVWGEGPSDERAESPRVPLSRAPPPQGTFELAWTHRESGVYLGAGVRWAAPQTRLAITDASDPRIPFGGTPGYAVLDLRAAWRARPWLEVGLVGANLGDAAYRVHGSSVLGAGRSVRLWLRLGL